MYKKMAQPPPDQNFYHHSHPHSHPHPHPHTHPHAHPQLQLPPQFRNPFELSPSFQIFDERTGAINYNYIRPYIPNQIPKPEDLSDSLVMRRPRRTRTTFTSAQIAELEQHFLQGRYLTSSRLAELSSKLALGTAQVKIWFKNRRRRHKIQSDQQKDHSFTCDPMQLSPLVPSGIKTEHVSNASSVPPSLHTLNLGGSGGSTPTTLTPSPTPSTPTASHVDPYGEAYSAYYFNGSSASSQSMMHHSHPGHVQQYPPNTPTATTQFFPPHSSENNPHQHAQMTGSHHHHAHQFHSHQYEYQHKSVNGNGNETLSIKEDQDYNINNSYYMRGPSAGSAATTIDPTSNPMSPNSEAYEPLTPKNDESPSLCNRGNKIKVHVSEEMDIKSCTRALHSMVANCSINTNRGSTNLVKECNGAFMKYKNSSGENPDSNYQCTMDTIMQAYSCHRNSSGNAQFAYCFN